MNQKREYPWSTLEIDETDDKKAIKKAYAVLIKEYKPDEHPEEFQEIQEAYKQAITSLTQEQNTAFKEDSISTNLSKKTALAQASKDESEIVEKILLEMHSLVNDELKEPYNLQPWRFIETFKKINDLDLKAQTAQKVFELVAYTNIEHLNIKQSLKIPMTIIKYLNGVFDWQLYWKDYQKLFPEDVLNMMFSQLDNEEPAYKIGLIGYEGRLKCFVSDMYPSLLIALIGNFFHEYGTLAFEFIKLAFLTFSIHRFIFEFLFLNSIGKLANNAFLVNKHGELVSRIQIIIKHLVINFTLFPMYAWIFDRFLNDKIFLFNEYIDYKYWSSFFWALIFVNIITLITKKRFLHEIISGIYVMHKEPEEKAIFTN